MCSIPDYLKTNDLELITGKSNVQCRRDLAAIKKSNNKQGRNKLVTHHEVAAFYGITPEMIYEKLTRKKQ